MQPPAPLVRMMDEEESSHKLKQSVSKVTHDAHRRPTSNKTASNGRGHRGRATPLIPKKAVVGVLGESYNEKMATSSGQGLDVGKLHSILRGYGEYPAKYR